MHNIMHICMFLASNRHHGGRTSPSPNRAKQRTLVFRPNFRNYAAPHDMAADNRDGAAGPLR